MAGISHLATQDFIQLAVLYSLFAEKFLFNAIKLFLLYTIIPSLKFTRTITNLYKYYG